MLPPKEDGSSGHHQTQYQGGVEEDILAAKSLHSFDLNFSSAELREGDNNNSSSTSDRIKEDDSLGFGFLDKKISKAVPISSSSGSNNPFELEIGGGTASSPPRASFEGEEEDEEDDDEEDNEEDDERTSNSLIEIESSSSAKASIGGERADQGQGETTKVNQDLISSSSRADEYPMGGSTTTVDETSSGGGSGGSGAATAIEVVEVLKNLEDYKTPDPVDMESSIVRANFVDFSIDDENDHVESPTHHHQLIEHAQVHTTTKDNPTMMIAEDDDESKEFSLSLNPDLPKIRAQQIHNWLEFEKENEKEDSLLLEGKNKSSGADDAAGEGAGSSSSGGGGGGGSSSNTPYDLDSLSEATGGTTTTVTDADGVQRRVRFLTDPHGNILISVYLTKLVQLILSILKLVSAGYLDFTTTSSSSSTATTTTPSTPKSILDSSSSSASCSSSSALINSGSTPLLDDQDGDQDDGSSEIDPLLASSFNFLCHYNETDDYVIPNGDHNDHDIPLLSEDGEEQIEAVHQANGDGTYGAALLEAQLVNIDLNKFEELNVEVKQSQSPVSAANEELVKAEETGGNDNNESSAKKEESEMDKENAKPEEGDDETPKGGSGASGDKKKVVSADPNLSNFDETEDIGSDSETMSTSSCSSMIEVVPKASEDGEQELEFIKNDDSDENNNEMKIDTITLGNSSPTEAQEAVNEIKSVIEVKGEQQKQQASTEGDQLFAPSAPPAAAIVDVTLKNEDQQVDEEGVQAPVETESKAIKHGVTSVLLNASPTQDGSHPTVAEMEEPKFNPTIDQHHEQVVVNAASPETELKQSSLSAAPLSPQLKQEPTGNQVIHITSNNPIMQAVEGGYNQLPENFGDEHGEKQLESLCIQEEPISAVALTIAKWESLSKKQKPKEPVERTNSAPKGNKLVLPTYAGNGGQPSNNAINIASIAQHQIHGKPVQVLPTGCNLNGILQSKMLGLNHNNGTNGNNHNSSVPGSPTSRSESPANSINTNNNNKLSAAGWSAFNNSNNHQNKIPNEHNTNKNSSSEEEEAIYAQPNAHGGSLTTSLANPSSILKSYPKPNSKGEIINWFKEGEIHRSGILLSYGQANSHQSPTPLPQNVTSPVIVSWFFGMKVFLLIIIFNKLNLSLF